MPIWGWDASDFDWDRGPMDLGSAARDGIQFFTHKAWEGSTVRHARYGEALRRARDAGIEFLGAYFVPRTPGNNGHGSIPQQVGRFLAYVDAQTPWWRTFPGWFWQVDTEHWGYDDVAPKHGAEACALLRAQTGKWVVHYAPRWAYGDSIPGDDPLWASSYGGNPEVPYRQAYPGDGSIAWAPYSRRTPVFLQYGSWTRIGSQHGCDANAFRGTVDQLRALITDGDDLMGVTVGGEPIDQYLSRIERALWWPIPNVAKDVAALRASAATAATAITGLRTAVDAMAAAIKAGGGSVDVAAIVAAIDAKTSEVKAVVEQRHTEEMAELKRERDAEVASLQAQLDALRPTAG